MRLTSLLAAGLAAALSAPASAEIQDTASYLPNNGAELVDLIRDCEEDQCMSYVSGVVGGISIYAMMANKPTPFCAGETVETGMIRDVIVSTITSTPMLEKTHPALGILAAFGRTWPCMMPGDIEHLRASTALPLEPADRDLILDSNRHILVLGPEDADANKTLVLFHDPSNADSNLIRAEMTALVDAGWRVTIYPVALEDDDAAGYGAVQMALRDISPKAVSTLYEATPEGPDFVTALGLARDAGVSANQVMTALANSVAYADVEANTRLLSELGVQSAPAWLVGSTLHTGYLSATAIRNIAANGNLAQNAPSPRDDAQSSQKLEQ